MKITPVSVINQHLSDGAAIEGFRGKLTKLFPMRTRGQGESAFTKQEGELLDEDGATIKVEFRLDGNELDKNRVGRKLTVTSTKTEKHGLKGVTVLDDTYNGTTTRKLKITKTANLEWDDGNAGTAPAGGSTQQQATAPAGGSAPAPRGNAQITGDPRADGPRAGMCIGKAVELLIAAGVTKESLLGEGSTFAKDVYFLASKLHLVAVRLEQGKLDPRTVPAKAQKTGPTEEEKAAAAEAAKREEQLKREREQREEQRRREDEEIRRANADASGGAALGIDDDEVPF